MAKHHSIYWHNEVLEFRSAFLYHLRDNDVQQGGKISEGEITEGAVGYVAAESTVLGWTVKAVPFHPTRRCEWQGFELPCMVHRGTPPGRVSVGKLRPFNYIVAEVTHDSVAQTANFLGLHCVLTPEKKRVLNLEISRFEIQGKERPATLLP